MESNLIFLLEITVNPDKIEEFEENFHKFWAAHFKSKMGLGKSIKFYKTFVGSEGIEIIAMVSIDKFENMDLFQHTPEMILEYYGFKEGAKIMTLYSEGITIQKSRLIKSFDIKL